MESTKLGDSPRVVVDSNVSIFDLLVHPLERLVELAQWGSGKLDDLALPIWRREFSRGVFMTILMVRQCSCLDE